MLLCTHLSNGLQARGTLAGVLSLITIVKKKSGVAGRCFSLFDCEVGCLSTVSSEINLPPLEQSASLTQSQTLLKLRPSVFVSWYSVRESDLAVISQAGDRCG